MAAGLRLGRKLGHKILLVRISVSFRDQRHFRIKMSSGKRCEVLHVRLPERRIASKATATSERTMTKNNRKLRRSRVSPETTVESKIPAPLRRALGRLSAAQVAFLGFVLFIAVIWAISSVLLSPRDLQAECKVQCAPRGGQLGPDKDYPMSGRGKYRDKCICS